MARRVSYPGNVDKPKFKHPHIQCAHEACPDSAIVRQRTITGFANFCRTHYDAYWLGVAKGEIKEYEKPIEETFRGTWYRDRGLPYEPPRKVRDVLAHWTLMHGALPKPPRQREPGDDDEMLDAQGNPV